MGGLTNRWKGFVLPCVLALAPPAVGQTSEQLPRLTNPATTDAERSELIARCSKDPQLRAGLDRVLPSMLKAAPTDNVMESEAKLAGALKLENTIPALVARLPIPFSCQAASTTALTSLMILWRAHSTISVHQPYRRLPKPSRVPIHNREFGPFRFLYSQTAMQAEPFSGLTSLPNQTQACDTPSS